MNQAVVSVVMRNGNKVFPGVNLLASEQTVKKVKQTNNQTYCMFRNVKNKEGSETIEVSLKCGQSGCPNLLDLATKASL